MRIGEMAHRTGASAKAIRLYESRGLLGVVARAGSYRQYGEADVARERQRLRSLDHQLATLETELHACGDRGVPVVPQDCVSGAAAG